MLRWLPLAGILGAQAVLSAAVMRGTVASPDEARYITAGHQLIYELWHGGGSPYYETYFSGAPDFYSPLAAVADSVGGLAAVRLMSLTFMLTATVLLCLTARHLFGEGAALAAAGLFAGLGLTQDLGVYANYDALALMLLGSAAYCAARSRESRWLLLVPLALLGANLAKYMSIVFDPVVIGMAALQLAEQGWRAVRYRVLALGLALGSLLGLAAYVAGSGYVAGIMFTTLDRPAGASVVLAAQRQPVHVILAESAGWIGAVVALGVCGILLAGRPASRHALLALLVVAGLLVTIEGLRLHSGESMRQHDDFGAWFTCIAAGYALSVIPARLRSRQLRYGAALVAAAAVAALGVRSSATAAATYEGKAPAGVRTVMAFAAAVRPYLSLPGARIALGSVDGFQVAYLDHVNIPWFRFFNDDYLKYPLPGRGGDSHGQAPGRVCFTVRPGCVYLEGPAAYRAAVHAHYFALISLAGGHRGTAQDRAIAGAVARTPGYVLLTRAGGAPTWIYLPAYRQPAARS